MVYRFAGRAGNDTQAEAGDNDMIETFQELKESEPTESAEINFATIGAVFADGVTLIFDGQTEATEKHYKCNSFEVFSAGQRVKIVKDSGTYIVEYPIGNPRTVFTVDSATTATKASGMIDAAYINNVISFKTDSSNNVYVRPTSVSAWKKITVT